MPLEPNPMIIRQHDQRVVGPIQLLDEDGTPHNLSITPGTIAWRAYDRPGGTALFTISDAAAAANGGKLLLSTDKASGHFFCSMSSQATSGATPGHYPTEILVVSGNVSRTFEGPMVIVQERLL